jgi:hypothetical protein
MAIKSSMQASFGKLFDTVFAEAVKPFTGSYTGPGVYDPVEEQTTAQQITYTGRGVFTKFKAEQVDGIRIKATDVRLIVLTNEVTDQPQPGHRIVGPDFVTGQLMQYEVMPSGVDPVGVHYQIQLRAT